MAYVRRARRRAALATYRAPSRIMTKRSRPVIASRRRGPAMMRSGPRAVLSDPSKQYLHAMFNPFAPIVGMPPSIPDTISVPSAKISCRNRVTMTCGSDGNGWALLNPYYIGNTQNAAGSGLGTTFTSLIYTGSAGVAQGTSITAGNYEAAGNVGNALGLFATPINSSYSRAFSQANKVRVVGAGLRLTYSGVANNASGSVVVYKDPSNNRAAFYNGTAPLAVSNVTMTSLDDAAYGAVSLNTVYQCTYHPVDISDFDYQFSTEPSTNPVIANTVNENAFIMAIQVLGAPAGATFTCEFIVHYEGIGTGFHNLTTSPTDVTGFATISQLPRGQLLNTPAAVAESYFSKAAYGLLNSATSAVSYGAGATLAALGGTWVRNRYARRYRR